MLHVVVGWRYHVWPQHNGSPAQRARPHRRHTTYGGGKSQGPGGNPRHYGLPGSLPAADGSHQRRGPESPDHSRSGPRFQCTHGSGGAGSLEGAPHRKHRQLAQNDSRSPDSSRIERAGARSGLCAAAWPVSFLPFSPGGIEYSAPVARTTAFIQRTEPSLWILVWHDHCCLIPLARKLSPIAGEQCRGRAT
jgi:hypothetical protein